MFDTLTRTHYDNNDITHSDNVNNKLLDYNLYHNSTSTRSVQNVALSQPNINFSGCVPISDVIDSNSKLLLSSDRCSLNHDRSSIVEPVFYSRPYLGKGNHDASVETYLRNGEDYRDKQFSTRLSLKSTPGHKTVPLLSNVKKSLANPANFVEQISDSHWIRGGLPTRELAKE